ncbi:hypothetical protein R3P38DRAFT_3236410 [Favolaschia claudopus]|uniref:Uncharacterized protein n=1 Tax=Favolaschia claudopus TaxID=2862362 RepID=A0AAV9ZDG3_9AGAR
MDTKRFSTTRLRSGHGYDDKPGAVNSGFNYRLQGLERVKSRIVESEGRRWMIWSPNSSQDPFYPGGAVPLVSGFTAVELQQRRCDGHCGRYDAAQNPQPYAKDMPWLGFVKRAGERTAGEAEYETVMSAWFEMGDRGQVEETHVSLLLTRNQELEALIGHVLPQIQGSFPALCSQRPKAPRPQDIELLKGIREFEEALDRLVQIHRGIREKQAWYTLARLRVETSVYRETSSNQATTLPVSIPPADDAFLGAWINGVEETTVEWLLHVARLPCFVETLTIGQLWKTPKK